MRITRPILLAFVVCCALAVPLLRGTAQSVFPQVNGEALAGVKEITALVVVPSYLDMPGDRDLLQRNAQSAFELGLRRDGLIVDFNPSNVLFCRVSAVGCVGMVVYHFNLHFYRLQVEGVHRLLWTNGAFVTVGRNWFSAENVVKNCVDMFANEWLRWNPRR